MTNIFCSKKYFAAHAWLLVALSIALMVIGSLFKINDLYDHPQFTEWSDFESFLKAISSHGKEGVYQVFFMVDFIWAPTLLLFLYRLLCLLRQRSHYRGFRGFRGYLVVAVLTVAADVVEGIFYLSQSPEYLESWVVGLKKAFYTLSFLWFTYGLLHYWFSAGMGSWFRRNYYLKSIKVFFSTSYISLILVIVLILLGTLPQGYTMVVDLLDRPINLLFTFFLLFLLALIASHYPAYLEVKKYVNPKRVKWKVWPRNEFLSLGLIYYEHDSPTSITAKMKMDWLEADSSQGFSLVSKYLRHHLGTAIFVAFLYILGYAGESIFDGFLFSKMSAWAVLIAAIWWYAYLRNQDGQKQIRVFKIASLLGLIAIIVAIYFSCTNGWSSTLLYCTIVAVILLLATYLSLRLCRRQLMNDCTDDGRKSTKRLVQLIAVPSFLSLLFLIAINVHLDWAELHSSAIVIVLLYGLHYYGLTVLPIKVSQLYGEPNFRNKPGAGFLRVVPRVIFPSLLLFSFFLPSISENKLHYLEQIPERSNEVIALDTYTESFKSRMDSTAKPIMYTSYGGGLMADLWAMIVTQELQEMTAGKFLKHTFNMSGNSGGGVGFGNYTNLVMHTQEPVQNAIWDDRIESVGDFNHLSLDLTFLFGRDMIRKFIPNLNTESTIDRNSYSMMRYSAITGDEKNSSFSKTYRSYWREVYLSQDSLYPSLTVSTTSIDDGGLANAFSLQLNDSVAVFHGIENILDVDYIGGKKSLKSISFYDAVSTTNRFPILSSAAVIEGRGQFIDGGAYDNSGLLNSLELLREIAYFDMVKPHYVTISNDTESYIASIFGKWKDHHVKETVRGEIAALIKGGVVIDRASEHLEEEVEAYLDDPDERVQIMLPRFITYQQVIDYLGGIPEGHLDTVMIMIDDSNEKIINALKKYESYPYGEWGIVQAPLARLLSEPAKQYEYAMLRCHEDVRDQLKRVKSLL